LQRTKEPNWIGHLFFLLKINSQRNDIV